MTKITLRKANQYQQELSARIKNLDVSAVINLDLYDDVDRVVEDASERYANAFNRKENLMRARWYIRRELGHANAKSGVQALITQMNELKERCVFLEHIISTSAHKNNMVESAKASIVAQREKDRVLMGGGEHLRLIGDDELEEMRNQIRMYKKDIADLNDECIGRNSSNYIDVPNDIEAILKSEYII